MKSSRSLLPMGAGLCASLCCLGAVGCVTEDVDPVGAGGSAGSPLGGAGTSAAGTSSGGVGGGAGGGSSGGAGGFRNAPGFATVTPCPALVSPLITDFTPVAPAVGSDAGAADAGGTTPAMGGISFGDYTTTFSGGVFT